MTLPVRTIGSLQVSALGLGCMGMSLAYGRPDADEAGRTLARALELGVTMFDTADVYGRGANEELVGRHLRPAREKVTVATKVGLRTNLLGVPNRAEGGAEHVRTAVDASLRRLRTDHVDLLYLHRVDPRTPVEESVAAMADAVTAGKVREIGLSEATGDELRRAHAVHPIAALQTEWSLFSREIEADALPAARELGVTVVPYSPLGRGMLTGAPSATTDVPLLDVRRVLPRWRRRNLQANLEAVARVRRVADRVGATPGQVALAWLLAQGQEVVPIPGTKRVGFLEENLAATDVHLSARDMQELSAVVATGGRYQRDSATPGVG